jgi:hypothetical protein
MSQYFNASPDDVTSADESPLEKRQTWNVTGNEDILENRAYGDVIQQTAALGATQDMMVISQPPNIPLNTINSYAYQDEVSGTVRIYVVDSGANTQHQVSSGYSNECNANWLRHTRPSSVGNRTGFGLVIALELLKINPTLIPPQTRRIGRQEMIGTALLVFPSKEPIFLDQRISQLMYVS